MLTSCRSFVAYFSAVVFLTSGCSEAPKAVDTYLKNADSFVRRGDYPRAKIELAVAMREHSSDSRPYVAAAEVEEALGHLPSALNFYASAARKGADQKAFSMKVVHLLSELGSYRESLTLAMQLLGSRPGDPDALAWAAFNEAELGEIEKARQHAYSVLSKDASSPVANAVLAKLSLDSNDASSAISFIDRGSVQGHPDPILLKVQARAYEALHEPAEMIRAEQSLLQIRPNFPGLLSLIAEQKAQFESVEAGEAFLRSAFRKNPLDKAAGLALLGYVGRHDDFVAADSLLKSLLATGSDDTVYDIELAQSLLFRNNDIDAANVLRRAADRVKEGPARAKALIGLARLKENMGDLDASLELLDQALINAPTDDDALLRRGVVNMAKGLTEHAVPDFLSIYSRHPASISVLQLLADADLRLGKVDEALSALRRWAALRPNDLAPIVKSLDLCMHSGRGNQAAGIIGGFVQNNPLSNEARLLQARIALQTKDLDRAEELIASLAVRGIPSAQSIMLEAGLDEARGNFAQAKETYQRALKTSDHRLVNDALAGFTRTVLRSGNTAQAVMFLGTWAVARENIEIARASSARAILYLSIGKKDEADVARAQALKLAPKDVGIYIEQATDLASHEEQTSAIQLIEQGIAAGAKSSILLGIKASIQSERARYDDAIESYRLAIKADPTFTFAWNNLGALLASRKGWDRGELMKVRNALSARAWTDDDSMLDTLAWIDYRLGDSESALKLLTKANAQHSRDPLLRYHLGAVMIALGKQEEGRHLLSTTSGLQRADMSEVQTLLQQSQVEPSSTSKQ